MNTKFPSAERNKVLQLIAADPRWKKRAQERPSVPLEPPTRFRRVGGAGQSWDLSRTLRGYKIEKEESIGGKATKWVIRGPGGPDDFFIAKFGNKNGRTEVFTELFNNRLGSALGFDIAHSGVARLDEHLYFTTRNFRRSEVLVHGSLMIEDLFSAKKELDNIESDSEQSFYSINFVKEVIFAYCGEDAETVFSKLVEMLVFDALIGSMDRHAMNWGVLRSQFSADGKDGQRYRLAPIFDSARALLWDHPEGKLLSIDADPEALERYVLGAGPCIGPERGDRKVNRCNHFDFIESLAKLYPHQTRSAYERVPTNVCGIANRLLHSFPFERAFSSLRKRSILKVLQRRADRLEQSLTKGGDRDNNTRNNRAIFESSIKHRPAAAQTAIAI